MEKQVSKTPRVEDQKIETDKVLYVDPLSATAPPVSTTAEHNAIKTEPFQDLDLPTVKLNPNKIRHLTFHLRHPERWKNLNFIQIRNRRLVAVLVATLAFLLFVVIVSPSDPMADFFANK